MLSLNGFKTILEVRRVIEFHPCPMLFYVPTYLLHNFQFNIITSFPICPTPSQIHGFLLFNYYWNSILNNAVLKSGASTKIGKDYV